MPLFEMRCFVDFSEISTLLIFTCADLFHASESIYANLCCPLATNFPQFLNFILKSNDNNQRSMFLVVGNFSFIH